jgi:hypothetical protein
MWKKILVTTALVGVFGVLVFGAVNRTLSKNDSERTGSGKGGYGRGSPDVLSSEQVGRLYSRNQGNGRNSCGEVACGDGVTELTNLHPATPAELSADEFPALVYLLEEEKLAHDLYVTFYEKLDLPIFKNISQSEQTYMDAIKTLLNQYGIDVPVSNEIGIFTDPDLQTLYNDLVARGNQSSADAIKVGALVEEIDILDLQERLTQTSHIGIQQVFTNLERASSIHLRTFALMLRSQTGETYQPQYLSAETYWEIINTGMRTGEYGNSGGDGQGGGYRDGRP